MIILTSETRRLLAKYHRARETANAATAALLTAYQSDNTNRATLASLGEQFELLEGEAMRLWTQLQRVSREIAE